MDDAIVEMANQFSLESSRNYASEVTIGRRHSVELLNSERYVSKLVPTKKTTAASSIILFLHNLQNYPPF